MIKKMVYLYLTNYARTHPELAQMCTNTLQKDCGNEDPMVRGLALRALCGLNLPQMVEYISEPLRRALSDGHPYVRKTGVMGLLKLYYLDPESFEENGGFVDLLYDMLRDTDASVVTNCIIVLNEVMQKNGGMAINQAIMFHLLNRLHEFDEFGIQEILKLVPRYIPANEDEGYQIMNLLDPILRTASAGAAMAAIRAFLSLAEQLGGDSHVEIQRQIIQRVKAPLVTQISCGSSEHMYTLLKHVEALSATYPGIFDDEYRQFYIRYNEPTYVKYVKVQILPNLANADTAPDIVSELASIVSESSNTNVKLARTAVKSMVTIACSDRGGPGAAEAIARRLVDMLDMNLDHISPEAAVALTLALRKHPTQLKELVSPPLVRSLKYMTDPTGKAAVIYLLGECGDKIPQAPYALEKLIDSYDQLEDNNVKQALLTTTVKLFFQRPAECQRMLGRLFSQACEDVSSQDLHDRALLYYRMLQAGGASNMMGEGGAIPAETLERVVKTDSTVAVGQHFCEEKDEVMMAELMKEFNTLTTLYDKTSEHFISPQFQVKLVKQPAEHPLEPGAAPSAPTTAATTIDVLGGGDPTAGSATAAPPPPQAEAGVMDLLGFGTDSTPAPAPPPAAAGTGIRLAAHNLSSEDYQNSWGSIDDGDAIVSSVFLNALPAGTEAVETKLAGVHCHTMASGALPTELKFFMYAKQEDTGTLFLIQANIDTGNSADPMMIVTVKVVAGASGAVDSNALVVQLTEIMTNALNA